MDENKNKGDLLQKEVKSSEKEMKDDKFHTGEDDLPEIKNGEDANDVIRSKSENGNVDTSKCEDTEDINDQVNKSKSNNMVVNTERDTSETKNSEEVTNEVDKSEDKTEPEIVGKKDTEISQSENNNPATKSSNNEILEVKNSNDENLSVLSSEPVESNTINSKESETKKARNDDNIEITGELSQTTTDETKEIEKKEEIKDDLKDLKTESTESNTSRTNVAPVIELRHMLEDIEEGELDYDEEDTDMGDGVEDLPDLPEYDPSANDKGDPGEIVSDNNDEEREEGEIADDEDDEGGQVYICVDPLNDKWKKMSKADQKDLEEGQIEDDDEVKKVSPKLPSPGRFIPRTLCKYYKNGLCRWGSTCRFLHPGVNDQGIPSDVQPTWNATAGNYVMHRPPGMYPNAFGKAPPPMECINVPVMPAPVVDMSLLSTVGHAEIVAVPVAGAVYPEEMPVRRESAWEKGLRRAKEIKEAGARRRREDADFEKKKLSMRITETVHDESNYEPVPAYPGEKTYDEWNIDDYGKSVDYPEHRHRDERRSRYSDRFSRTPKEPSLDRSSGRARIAELPSSHPMRREERQRLRERERREKAEKNDVEPEREFRRDPNTQIKISSKSMSSKVNVTDPRVRSSFKQTSNHSVKTPLKTTEPTEWHDPWMRTQQTATAQLPKTDLINKSGVEAISDSDSSSSDSDSDSDSSSSSKSSGSKSVGHSSGSDTEKRSKQHNYSSSGSKVSDSTRKEPRPFQQQSEEKSGKVGKSSEKNEPLSYEEWKRLQTIQKAQYHQQMANQYKNNLGGGEAPGRDNSSDRHKERYMKQSSRIEEDKRNTYPNNQRPLSSTLPGRHEQISKPAVKTSSSLPPKDISMVNDDKFDSPKRRATQSDSDSGSDSDSASDSDSSGSDSDSDDTDSDSDSDTAMPSAPPSAPSGNNKTGSSIKFGQMEAFAKKVALAEKFGGFSQDPLKFPSGEVKPVEAPVSTLAGKRPARKDELLKELKAVEDAIARKRAKID